MRLSGRPPPGSVFGRSWSTAVSRHACGRPRCGAVAAVLPHWSHDDACRIGHTTSPARWSAHAPSRARCHRLQTATGAERCANAGTAQRARNGRRAYPANRHHVWSTSASAGARACGVCRFFGHFDPDRRGLWVRHADTHAQTNSYRPRAHPGRMSAHAAAAGAPQSLRRGAGGNRGGRPGFGRETNRGSRLGGPKLRCVRFGLSTRPSRNPGEPGCRKTRCPGRPGTRSGLSRRCVSHRTRRELECGAARDPDRETYGDGLL